MNYKNTDVTIIRDSEAVFGDGCHESTQVVLEALYQQKPQGKTVLDIGTGTGIQSIFAKKWGAAEVTAVDVDMMAVKTARKNFTKNDVEVTSRLNIYNELLDVKADITVANLPTHNVVEFVPMAKETMADGGVVIFSWSRQFNVQNEVNLDGYEIIDRIDGIDWDAYVIRRAK